jgi:uncharacterized protein with PQ loop repeat
MYQIDQSESILSNIFGWISIFCWIVVFTPQLYKNYVNETGESLSLLFLGIWLIGDIFNVVGVIMENLLLTMLLLAIYYTIVDSLLIYQVLYYRNRNHNVPLLPNYNQRYEYDCDYNVDLNNMEIDTCWCLNNWTNKLILSIIGIFLFAIISGIFVSFVSFAQYTGWSSAILYISSRIPQIIKNTKEKSVQGLSFLMFFFGICGNASYFASILLQSTEKDYIKLNLPWLTGSIGTIFFDTIIGIQFLIYR